MVLQSDDGVARFEGAVGVAARGGHGWRWLCAAVTTLLLIGAVLTGAPTQAHAQQGDPKNWDLPADVNRTAQVLYRIAADGSISTGSAGPGTTFFYGFELTNRGSEPVTVTGFAPNFIFQMHPSLQGSYPADHCMQFIEVRPSEQRVAYPVVIAPGESKRFADSETYHYIWGPVSNECQAASFFFGPPTFLVTEIVTPVVPEWHEATCDGAAAVRVPEQLGVVYDIDGTTVSAGDHEITAPHDVTVTAAAGEGFTFADGAVSSWSHAFAAPDCAVPPTDPDDTAPPVDDPGAAGPAKVLAASGAGDVSPLWLGGLAAIGLGGLALALRARVSRR